MTQNFSDIQAALDAVLSAQSFMTAIGSNFVTENTGSNFAMLPDITSLLAVRSTLVPAQTEKVSVGLGGYGKVMGIYVLDIIGAQNQGYEAPKALGDQILATFTSGMIITLGNGDTITIDVATPSTPNAYGAKAMGKIYLTQIHVHWFGYTLV